MVLSSLCNYCHLFFHNVLPTFFNVKFKLPCFCQRAGIIEALPGVFGNRVGKTAFISEGNKGQSLRGTGEQRQYWGKDRKQIFDFGGTGELANLFQGNEGRCTPGGPHH